MWENDFIICIKKVLIKYRNSEYTGKKWKERNIISKREIYWKKLNESQLKWKLNMLTIEKK